MTVREIEAADLRSAAAVIARGMRDNPLHVAALGTDSEARAARLFRMFAVALPIIFAKGAVLGAFDGRTLIGIAGIAPPGRCQPTLKEKFALLPRIVPAVGGRAFARIGEWTGTWARYDPEEPHWHLGPVAVDAHLQRTGIGSLLLADCCVRIDRDHGVGYLETDKPGNVAFYERFGFETVRSMPVLNTPNWFMRRAAR